MKQKTYQHLVLLFITLNLSSVYTIFSQEGLNYPYDSIFEALESQDSIVSFWNNKYKVALETKDTILQIKTLNTLGDLYANRIDYDKSYDSYWKALLLGEKHNYFIEVPKSYNGIATLYDLYERKDESLEYYKKSLRIAKKLISEGLVAPNEIIKNYHSMANYYYYDNKPALMKSYLDSCAKHAEGKIIETRYLKSRIAFLHILEKKYELAEKELLSIEEAMKKTNKMYLTIFYSSLGDLYLNWNKPHKAIDYYNKSNNFAIKNKKNLNFLPDNYKKLSDIYNKLGDKQNSLIFGLKSSEIYRYLYSSRSPKNKFLLEIKDQLMLEQQRLEKLAATQKLEKLEHQESLWQLRYIIILISIISIVITGFVFYRYITNKHANEKKILLQKKNMEQKQSKQILEIKNKELTQSTLQLITKDELLSDIKASLSAISADPNPTNIKKLIKEININSKENWSEFESRFTHVNEGFYERMKIKYPDLSPYDLKVSALVKLGFSGKKMAKVMGISYQSANTARYRLRKRLGLNKEDDLVSFIKEI